MRKRSSLVKLALLLAVSCLLFEAKTASFTHQKQRKDAQVEMTKRFDGWDQTQEDLTIIDTDVLPDYHWEPRSGVLFEVDRRVLTNGAEPPEQLVKVTDRKHKFPVFATICSMSFLATVITLLIVCTR